MCEASRMFNKMPEAAKVDVIETCHWVTTASDNVQRYVFKAFATWEHVIGGFRQALNPARKDFLPLREASKNKTSVRLTDVNRNPTNMNITFRRLLALLLGVGIAISIVVKILIDGLS